MNVEVGMKFGRLTVVGIFKKNSTNFCKAACDCGNITFKPTKYLSSGDTKSCGCLRNTCKNKIYIGMTKNYLTVKELTKIEHKRIGRNNSFESAVKCSCICGNVITVTTYAFVNENAKSCGCYNIEKTIERNKTHDMSKTRIYKIWKGMKRRCYAKNCKAFPDYGGRGIEICKKWHDFENFYNDMFENYNDKLTIERIDTNKNYCKENCRWASKQEQAFNTRKSVEYFYDGKWYKQKELAILLNTSATNIFRKFPRRKLYEDNEQQ